MKECKNDLLKRQLMKSSGYLQQFSFDAACDTRLFHVEAGEYIMWEGERPEYLYYLAAGRAKLYVTMPNGRVSLIDFFTAPCFIGEMELVNEEYEARAVQAIEAGWCLALPMKQCRSLLLNDVLFLRGLCVLLSRKNYRNIVASTQNQAFPLANRLAAFILMTQNRGFYHEKHTQAAEYLGVSYRHLLYVFAQFTRDGFLKKQSRGYQIVNKGALDALAREMVPDLEYADNIGPGPES